MTPLSTSQKTNILKYYGLHKEAKVPIQVDSQAGNQHQLYDPTFAQTDGWLGMLPYPNTGPNSAFVDLHGGGGLNHYGIANNQHGMNHEAVVQNGLGGYFGYSGDGHTNTLADGVERLSKAQLHKLHSIACNVDGGGTPEFYDNLLGGQLNEVEMTPPGFAGVPGQGQTNLGVWLYNHSDPGDHQAAAQHIYKKEHVDSLIPFMSHDKWVDHGDYTPPIDQFVNDHGTEMAGGAALTGIGLLAARHLWKKRQAEQHKKHGTGYKEHTFNHASRALQTA